MQKPYRYLKQYWQLAAMIFFMTAISGLCHQTGIMEWLRFWGFQIFCLLIPGMAVMILMPMRNLKSIEKVLFSYAAGYMLTIVLYLFIMVTVGSRFLKVFFAVIAAVSLVVVWHHIVHREGGSDKEESFERMWVCAILAVFVISLIASSLRWRIPYIGESNRYHSDYLFWVRRIAIFRGEALGFIELLKDRPYHYLGMIQQAAAARLTDISAFGMASQYSHIEASVFLGLSSYAIVDRFIRNKKAQIITLFLILFSTGLENQSIVTYIWHIYLVPMSYHIAQSLGVLTILLILIQLDEEFDFYKFLMTVALLVCCTGTKGATGAVIFVGVVLACMYSFWIQKKRKIAVVYFIGAFLGFGLMYLYLSSTAQSYSDTAADYLASGEENAGDIVEITEDGSGDTIEISDGTSGKVQEPKESLLDKGLKSTVGFVRHFLYINPWTMLPMIVFICYSIVRKSIKKEYWILFFMTMAGIMLGSFIVYYGHSEMYFTLTVFPFAALLTGCLWETIFLGGISCRFQSVIMTVLCSATVIFTVCFDSGGEFRKCLLTGLDNLWIFHDNIMDDKYGGWKVDYDEWYAYEWIRTNTAPEVLVLTNRLRVGEEGDLFYSLTERDIIGMEGYLEEAEEFEQYSDMGVDYIVFNKYLGQFSCPPGKGEILFENEQMIVCELY